MVDQFLEVLPVLVQLPEKLLLGPARQDFALPLQPFPGEFRRVLVHRLLLAALQGPRRAFRVGESQNFILQLVRILES